MDHRKRVNLSRGVLDMKFMKKTKEKIECTSEEKDANFPETFQSSKSNMVIFDDLSISNYHDLIDGRLSFKGMNSKIEEFMTDEYSKKLEEAEKLKEKDISDADMAKQYSSYNYQADKRNQGKSNKKNFRKPSDVDTLI